MALAAGVRLGPYEIVGPLGAGGMGEVYKARDRRLGRTVAIKVLPDGAGAALDAPSRADRRRRLEREAQVLSALNHPHICVLHDIGSENGFEYLVMECLDGHTLADRLTRKGRLALDETLDIGTQIADALAAAHRQGIVHGDLKPENVMLTKTGVKLLDFGIARLTEPATKAAGTAPIVGAVMGTLPYVAPEQLQGARADVRSDLFAFGAVLYEMLTGRRVFDGGSPAAVSAAILEHEPPAASTVDASVPPAVDRVLARCLAKNPDARWQTATDLSAELRWLRESSGIGAEAGVQPRRGRGVRTALVVAAGLALIALGAALAWFLRPAPSPLPPLHAMLAVFPAEPLNAGRVSSTYLPTAGGSRTALAWTPDGRALVYVGRRGAVQQLYVRRLDAAEARPLAGTEGAQVPAVSPDGRWVAFWAGGAIRKVPFGGGPAMDLASGNAVLASGNAVPPWGLSWDAGGTLFFGGEGQPIKAISAPNTVKAVTTVGDAELSHGLPWPLPGGRALLYTVRKRVWSWGDEEVVAQALAEGTRKVLLRNAADARYLSTGHLVFLRQGRMFAVPFDPERLQVLGQEVLVEDDVAQALTSGDSTQLTGAGQFAVAETGALAWLQAPVTPYPDAVLVTVDRQGRASPLPAPVRSYAPALRAAPDGRRLAVTIRTLAKVGLWFCDLETGRLTPRVAEGECDCPTWSPDGQRVAFWWLREGRPSLAIQPADGTAPPQVLVPRNLAPSSFTPDGRQIAVVDDLNGDISIAAVENGQAAVRPLLQTPQKEQWAELSPDGRWLAYGSDVSGRFEVWVKPYPTGVAVPVEAGGSPAWHPNGRELFFVSARDPSGRYWMMGVDFTAASPRPAIGRPHRLFEFNPRELAFGPCVPVRCYDVARDGQRFYVAQKLVPPPPPPVTHINLITNWFEVLKQKAPTSR